MHRTSDVRSTKPFGNQGPGVLAQASIDSANITYEAMHTRVAAGASQAGVVAAKMAFEEKVILEIPCRQAQRGMHS